MTVTVNREVVALLAAVACMLGGAWVIAPWAFGVTLWLLGAATVALVLLRDDDADRARLEQAPDLAEVLDRFRHAG